MRILLRSFKNVLVAVSLAALGNASCSKQPIYVDPSTWPGIVTPAAPLEVN